MPLPTQLVFIISLLTVFDRPARAQSTHALTVTPLTENVYVHTTYGNYGKTLFPSNGLIINTKDGVVLVDTGWDTDSSTENTQQLLRWVSTNLRQPVQFCIVTHAHEDRVGGIRELRRAGIRAISTPLTAEKSAKLGFPAPDPILPTDTTFTIGGEPIRCYFPGAGHTSDNIVVWLPNERILDGGCLVKSVAAFGMGNLADANLNQWPFSMRKLMKEFGNARVVVPGHEEWSDGKALTHTLNLLSKHAANQQK